MTCRNASVHRFFHWIDSASQCAAFGRFDHGAGDSGVTCRQQADLDWRSSTCSIPTEGKWQRESVSKEAMRRLCPCARK
jgi:hypothetical protein